MGNRMPDETMNSAQAQIEGAGEQANGIRHDAQQLLEALRRRTEEMARNSIAQAHEHAREPADGAVRQAGRAPDLLYLGAVGASMLISLLLLARRKRGMSLLVGLWPVTIISIGMMLKKRRASRQVETMQPHTEGASPVGAGFELMAE